MTNFKSQRKSCKDVFNAFLLKNANYSGVFEFPVITAARVTPKRIISFSNAIKEKDEFNQWVHFYEYDCNFEKIWRNPKRYLNILKKFEGVILPDFSLYYDMPFVMQVWNIFRSRAIGNWLQRNGIPIIPNVRFGDCRTFKFACEGISSHSIIAIGASGLIQHKYERDIFIKGFNFVVNRLHPKSIIIYGKLPSELKNSPLLKNVSIHEFECETSIAHKEKM